MKYPLPVIQSSPLINEEEYTEAMNQLMYIWKTEPVCDFDDAWNCFVARDWQWMPKSCCTTDCSQLWETWCTTKNIQCKTYYCGEAFKKLSVVSQDRVNEVKSEIVNVYKTRQYNPDEQVNNLYFKNEEKVKTMLKINTNEIPFDEVNLLKN